MKRFQFKFDTLLRVREEKENAAQQKLSFERQALQEHLDDKGRLENEGKDVEDNMRFAKESRIDAAAFVNNLHYMEALRGKIAQKEDDVMRQQNVVEEKRGEAAAAMRERKVIENLKEKKYGQWKREAAAAESAFLDEQATQRYYKDKQ